MDNNHVVYFSAWNFLTGETSVVMRNGDSDTFVAFSGDYLPRVRPSPDWTLAVHSDGQLYQILHELWVADLPLAEAPIISWVPDSSFFAAEVDSLSSRQLVFIDRTGHITDTVFEIPDGQRIGPRNTAWSSDRRYFAFVAYENSDFSIYINYSYPNTLYIADTQEHVVFDTCTSIGEGEAWSPDNTMLAVLQPGEGTKYVMILDLKSWSLHPVARHIVEYGDGVIGWRAD
jgi:hypothetical protein